MAKMLFMDLPQHPWVLLKVEKLILTELLESMDHWQALVSLKVIMHERHHSNAQSCEVDVELEHVEHKEPGLGLYEIYTALPALHDLSDHRPWGRSLVNAFNGAVLMDDNQHVRRRIMSASLLIQKSNSALYSRNWR